MKTQTVKCNVTTVDPDDDEARIVHGVAEAEFGLNEDYEEWEYINGSLNGANYESYAELQAAMIHLIDAEYTDQVPNLMSGL